MWGDPPSWTLPKTTSSKLSGGWACNIPELVDAIKTPTNTIHVQRKNMQPRQDSNLDQAFRKRLFYPLNYGALLQSVQ